MTEEEFYRQPSYSQRESDNLDRFLGLHLTTLDVVILLPLIPLLPFLVTWWLPWERWIPWRKLPKAVVGPYLLYCAFAAWHFNMHWWVVLIPAILGTAVCAAALKQIIVRKRALQVS